MTRQSGPRRILMGATTCLALLYVLSQAGAAMARPSWNCALIASQPSAADPLKALTRLQDETEVRPKFTGKAFADAKKTAAMLETPLARWLAQRAAARAGNTSEAQLESTWEQIRSEAREYLRIKVAVPLSAGRYASFRGTSTGIKEIYLVDDQGRRTKPARIFSSDVPADGRQHNLLKFPFWHEDGTRVLGRFTKRLELHVVADVGEAVFKFTFDPSPVDTESVTEWMTYYYGDPDPELVVPGLLALVKGGLFDRVNSKMPMIGFFAAVFRQNPERLAQWWGELKGLTENQRLVVAQALWVADVPEARPLLEEFAGKAGPANKPEAERMAKTRAYRPAQIPLVKGDLQTAGRFDLLWATFFATGDERYIVRLIEVLPWLADENMVTRTVANSAKWSLTSNSVQHDWVLRICLNELGRQPEEVAVVLRQIVADALKQRKEKSLPAVAETGPGEVTHEAPRIHLERFDCSSETDTGRCHDPF